MPTYTIRRFVPAVNGFPDRYLWLGTHNAANQGAADAYAEQMEQESGFQHFATIADPLPGQA